MSQKKIRILVVDDHTIVRAGLVALLDTESDIVVVGEAEEGLDALRQADRLFPDIILMDIMMPLMDGITATAHLHKKHPGIRILLLTTSESSDEIVQALNNGAIGAISKNAPFACLIDAIHSVAEGKEYIAPEIRQIITEDPPIPTLTSKQQAVLQSVTRGLTNADIANQLGIGRDRVRDHVNKIFTKLGAANRAEAVAIALRKHLLKI